MPPGGAPEAGAPPVCPRHPDRISYVRCQRCQRPVCPECQRVAAVGVQCVDCVKDGARTVRRARTLFGAAVPTDTRPVLTTSVIVACIVIWFAQITSADVTNRFLFMPVVSREEPWRFLTAAFLHSPGSPLHLAFNMYALWLTGPALEVAFGRLRLAVVYLLAALGGSVAMLVAAVIPSGPGPAWVTGSLGASGAVFGMFAALLVVNRRIGADNGALLGVLAINLVLGFTVPRVAWEAHLGGFLVGAACAWILVAGARPHPRLSVAARQAGGLAAVAAVLVAVVAGIWAANQEWLAPF